MKPKWIEIAEKEIGQHEVKGGENPRIIEYHSATTLKAIEDEIPWCSSFVCWCMEQAGITSTHSAAAKSWLEWGDKLLAPVSGCVVIIRHKLTGVDKVTGSSSGYHVAFWVDGEPGKISLLGGNQSDSVKVSSFPLDKYEICGYRMPINYAA